MKKTGKKFFYFSLIFIIIFSLFFKLFTQAPDHDETFILTLTQRIINGDKLFINEWNASQLTGYINLYVFNIYNLFFDNYRYIILFERILSLFLWILMTYFIFKITSIKLNKFSSLMLASYILLIFSSTIINIQYNVYSIGCMLFTFIALRYSKSKFLFIISGFIFSITVLAHPLNIIFYFIILLLALLKANSSFDFKGFVLFSILPLINLLIFIIYLLLNNINYASIMQNISFILAHANTSASFTEIIISHYKLFIMTLIIIISLIDKNRIKNKLFYIIIQSSLLVFLNLYILKNSFTYKYWYYYNIPLTIYILQFYFLTENKNKKNLGFYALGFIYSYILNFMSDTKIFIISLGLSLSIVLGFEIINDFFSENNSKALPVYLTKTTLVIQLFIIITIGYVKINLSSTHSLIKNGPFSGLYLNNSTADYYLKDIKSFENVINQYQDSKILVLVDPKLYLSMPKSPIYSYSSFMYFTSNEELTQNLKQYYAQNPEKKPDIIYFIKNTRLDENNILNIDYIIKNLNINNFEIILDTNDFYAIKINK